MRPASQGVAQILGQGADISALGALDRHSELRYGHFVHGQFINRHRPGRKFHRLAPAGPAVGPFALAVQGGVHRRDLGHLAHKCRCGPINLRRRRQPLAPGHHLSGGILGVGRHPQPDPGPVHLGLGHQVGRQLGGLQQAQRQQPRSHGVQGPQVADLAYPQSLPGPAHHLEGSHPFGFVNEEDAGDHGNDKFPSI